MHGEEHVGNATYLIIQALFTANSDYYRINWHFWLDGDNHLLITIMVTTAAVYQLGPFFSCKLSYFMLYTI